MPQKSETKAVTSLELSIRRFFSGPSDQNTSKKSEIKAVIAFNLSIRRRYSRHSDPPFLRSIGIFLKRRRAIVLDLSIRRFFELVTPTHPPPACDLSAGNFVKFR